jgi:hypothetical protein
MSIFRHKINSKKGWFSVIGYLYARIKNRCNTFQLRVLGISLVISILVFISQSFSLFPPGAQGDCGECPNPLVEMKNLRMGDISTIADLFKELAKEYYGWEEEEVTPLQIVMEGFNLLEFKEVNPCAEMYYTEMRWNGEEEEEIRHGAQQGTAKYNIQSTLNMVRAQPGERALVRRAVYDEKGHEISLQEDYVPKMGTVHIHHELTCLKNNEIYDEGDLRLDWLPEPPANEIYGYSEKGSDGIIVGTFSKGSIAGMPIELSLGDVGRTIRNKETPSAFSLDVEKEHLYPPYYELKIYTIRNLLGEDLPNKIFVALRVKYGEIKGGMKTQGWSVFPTEAGKIETPVLYKVPQCWKTKEDTIEMAAYCDWHAGEAIVGKPRASQKIEIICPELIADYNTTIKFNRGDGPNGTFFSTVKASYRLTSSVKTNGMIREHYKCLSSTLINFQGQAVYSRQWKSADCEGKCYGACSPSGPKIHQGGVGFDIYYDETTDSVQEIDLDSINVEVECIAQVQCTEKCKYPPYDRSFQFSISPFLERAIEVVNDMFKVERVSGSREGGVISGSAKLNAGPLGEWDLQFSFRKN